MQKKKYKPGPGRNSLYDPMFIDPVKNACADGATTAALCKLLGSLIGIKQKTKPPHNPISHNTLNIWRHKYPDFQAALDEGRASHIGELALIAAKKKMKNIKVVEKVYEPVAYVDLENPDSKERKIVRGEMQLVKRTEKTLIPSDKFVIDGLEKLKGKQFANVSNLRMTGPGGGPIQTANLTHDELIAAAKMRVKLKNGESIDDSGSSPETE